MRLFYVYVRDTPDDMSVFVWADSALVAVQHWAGYYEDWDLPDMVWVSPVPDTEIAGGGPVPWDSISATEYIVKQVVP